MGENDDLQILIEAALDFAKSMQNISRQLVQLQSQLNDYRLKITAGLDQATTASQIRQDLGKIDKGKPRIHLVGEMDRNATKAEVEKAVKSLKGVEVKLSAALDPLEAGKQMQNSLPDVPNIEASATVKVDGAEQVDELSKKLKDAGNSAAGMASKVYLARTALQLLRRTVKEAVDTVTELDACITDLSVATGQDRDETYKLLKSYNELAERIGATTSQIARAADEWLRQGHSLADTTTLIEDAMVLSKISQLDSANATQYLTSAMKGYEIAVQDVLGVVDKLSAVDLVSATNAGELAEAMSRTAVTANMAGVSMDRLLGYIATVGEVTQKSMSSVGEGFKTIFSRMNDIKANKLQLIDEDGTEETLSDVELTLKNVGIDLRATVNEYSNYGDVLDSLAAKWDTLSEVQQNALVKAFAGTRQGENFRVLMENYSSAAEYMQVAANSAGTALDKFSVYEESIEAKAASFTAAMENLTMDTVDSDLVKDLIDVGTAVVDFIDKIGLLKSALITLGAGGILKGISAISGGFRAAYKDVINLGEAITTLRNVDNLGADTIAKLGSLTAGLNDEQIKLVLTSTKLSTAQMQAILTAGGLTSEEAAQKIATLGLASSQKTATETTVNLSGAMTGLRAKIKAAFAGMSTTGKIISVLSLVTTAVSIGVSIWQSYKQSQEEARQAALDAAQEYEQAADSIEDYKERVLALKKSLDEGNLSQEEAYNTRKELLSIQNEIQEAYGKEAEAINLVGSSADSAVESLDGLTRALANEKLIEQADQLDKAVREMEKQRTFTFSISHVMTGPGIESEEPDPQVIKQIEDIVSKYKDAALKSWSEISRNGYGAHGLQLEISANATDAKETIVALAADLQELQKRLAREGVDLTGTIFKNWDVSSLFSDALNEVNEVIEDWEQLYSDRIRWKIVTDDNYADAMEKINDAGEALQEALASGDSEALAATIENINTLMLDPEQIDDEGVHNYMQGLIDKMQAEALKYTVRVKLAANVDGDEWTDAVKVLLGKLAGDDGVVTATDIREAGVIAEAGGKHDMWSDPERAKAYLELRAKFLARYGVEIEDAISLLEEYGYISKEVTEESKETSNAFKELGDTLSKLKDLTDPLITAMGEMMSGGGLSSGTAQSIIEKLTEAGLNYVDYLYEENGVLKLNTAAWADYIRTVNTANLEGVTEEQAAVLRELYNTLSEEMAGELYDKAISKLDELHDALDSLSDVDTLDIETFEKLRELMPDLIGNVHDVESAQAALTRAIERGEQEAEAAYGAMLYANQSWVQSTINSSVGLSNALSKYYGADVENWKDNAAAKWVVDSKLVQSLSELWSKYYGVSTQELEHELKSVEMQLQMANARFQRTTKNGKITASSVEVHQLQEQYDELKAALEMRKNAEKAFQELLSTSYTGSGVSGGSSGSGASKEVEEYIADIEKFREAAEALRKAQEEAERLQSEAENVAGDKERIELQRQLVDAYRNEQIAIQHLNAARAGSISESVDSLRRLGFAVEYNAETNELWIENLEHLNELTADGKGKYDSLQEATNALRKDTEDLIESITDLNEANRDGASTWLELRHQVVDCFLDIVDTAHDAVDEIQDVSSVLHTAADEFAANDGFITIDTLKSILKLEPQYLQLLKDENGFWEINEERVNAVIAAKSRQLAVENAMSYVEQLKVAAWAGEVDKLNELIFVSDSATSSTWGLVYAELELMRVMGELDDSQYAAALHNIQAMEDLAENAISHIGYETDSVAKGMESMRDQLEKTKEGLQDTLDELENMQDGASDLVDYVMDMLKDRIEQQIDLLEEMKDTYSDIIDLKKESLDASKDEQDYQKEISKKIKEMAKLQERINSLSLDDSRSAQAERAGLLEQMAELQEDLADTQADKAIEAQKEALDKMEEDYHAEKDKEIEALEESISSTQKLYDAALRYIRDHWQTLYSELIQWNTEMGSSLNSEITEAWEMACSAAERYGDFVSAVMDGISSDIDRITSQIEELDERISNLGSGSSGSGYGGGLNTTVSSKGTNSKQTNENMVRTIVGRMKDLGAQWNGVNSVGANDALHRQAERLAAQLDQYGVHAEYHPADGTWWITRDELYPNNVGKRLHNCYHTGGFVGKEPLKSNEQYIKAENGELMMTARQQDSLAEQINRIEVLMNAFRVAPPPVPKFSSVGSPSGMAQRIFNNIINNNSRPVEINMNGPTISCVPEKSVEAHVKVSRDMMNQIGNYLRRGN